MIDNERITVSSRGSLKFGKVYLTSQPRPGLPMHTGVRHETLPMGSFNVKHDIMLHYELWVSKR